MSKVGGLSVHKVGSLVLNRIAIIPNTGYLSSSFLICSSFDPLTPGSSALSVQKVGGSTIYPTIEDN